MPPETCSQNCLGTLILEKEQTQTSLHLAASKVHFVYIITLQRKTRWDCHYPNVVQCFPTRFLHWSNTVPKIMFTTLNALCNKVLGRSANKITYFRLKSKLNLGLICFPIRDKESWYSDKLKHTQLLVDNKGWDPLSAYCLWEQFLSVGEVGSSWLNC